MTDYEKERMFPLSLKDIINGCHTNAICPFCGELLILNDNNTERFFCPQCGQKFMGEQVKFQDSLIISYRGVSNDMYAKRKEIFRSAVFRMEYANRCDLIACSWWGDGGSVPDAGTAPWTVNIQLIQNGHAYLPPLEDLHKLFYYLTDVDNEDEVRRKAEAENEETKQRNRVYTQEQAQEQAQTQMQEQAQTQMQEQAQEQVQEITGKKREGTQVSFF